MKKSISKVLTLMLSFAMVFTSIGWLGSFEVNAEDEGTTATLYLQVKDTNGDPVTDAGLYLEPWDPDYETYTGDLMVDLDAPDTDGMIQINGDNLVNDYDDFSFYINDDEILFRIDSENYESDPVEGKLATDGSAWSFNLIGGKGDSASNPVVFTVPAAGGEDLEPAPDTTVPRETGAARSRKMTVDIDMSKYPAGQVVKVWVPVPQTEDFQTISEPKFEAKTAKVAKITTETKSGYNNKMLYLEWDANADPATRKASMYFFATRLEAGHYSDLVQYDETDYNWPDDVKPYITKTSEMVKIDGIVKEYADAITAGKTGTLEKARAIYEWEIQNLERIDNNETLTNTDGEEHTFTVEGCGYGNTTEILTDFRNFGRAGGHCTDLNSTFVALCRASGIPAREMFGIRLGKNATDDASGFQHCWAEFYLPGTGWVFADPGDVLKAVKGSNKNMSIEDVNNAKENANIEEFWAKVDNNRIVLSRGRDITFEPAQAWGTCNTFGYPAAEVGGKRNPLDFTVAKDFKYTITTKDVLPINYVKVQAGDVEDESWDDYGVSVADKAEFDSYFILDVRPDTNWQKGHLPGATHVAVTNSGDLERRDGGAQYIKAGSNTAKALDAAYEASGEKPILVVCVKGQTLAARALQYFNEKYFGEEGVDPEKVTYLIGGAEDGGIPEGTELETNVDYVKMRTANPSTWKAAGIAYDAITAGDFVLDVRPDDKWKAGHIKGSTHVDVTVEAGLDNGYVKAGSDLEKALDAAYTAAGSKRIVIVCNGGQTLAARAMQYYNEKHYGGFGVDFAKVTYLIGGATAIPKDAMVTGDDVTPAPAPAAPAVTDRQTATVGGNTYKVTSASAKTAAFTKAKKSKKSATVPATVTVNGVKLNVTSIAPKAFKGTKVKTLTVKSKKLTKKSVKGSLKGSKVKTVKVKVGKKKENKKYVKKYKKIFTKKNCGKKVKVK